MDFALLAVLLLNLFKPRATNIFFVGVLKMLCYFGGVRICGKDVKCVNQENFHLLFSRLSCVNSTQNKCTMFVQKYVSIN